MCKSQKTNLPDDQIAEEFEEASVRGRVAVQRQLGGGETGRLELGEPVRVLRASYQKVTIIHKKNGFLLSHFVWNVMHFPGKMV